VMDTREVSKCPDILEGLKKELSGQVTTEALKLGDYLILSEPPRLIERMTENEIISRRKMDQIRGMIVDNPQMKSFVLFEGSIDRIFYWRRIHPHSVYGKLLAILDGWNIPILFSQNKRQTVTWISSLHRRATSEKESKPFVRPSARKGSSFEEQQLHVLTGIQGLGYRNAKRLLEHFKSVCSVFNASVEELMKVEGIGKKLSEKIVSIATGKGGRRR